MDFCSVDFDRVQPDEPGQLFQSTRKSQRGSDVGSVDLVRIEMLMVVPCCSVASDVSR